MDNKTKLKERLILGIMHAIRYEVKESDGAHWEYPEREFEALMGPIKKAVDAALAAESEQ